MLMNIMCLARYMHEINVVRHKSAVSVSDSRKRAMWRKKNQTQIARSCVTFKGTAPFSTLFLLVQRRVGRIDEI
ncbi:hypothetical protein NTGM5_300013 [Candidatus Nitrotoga sp. M5]|nr:hypothetical protein NTGM5_300013 [Candidatus Nitrotoga sp. M5]